MSEAAHYELLTVGVQLGVIAALGFLGALLSRRSFRPGWFLCALVLYVIYDALLTRGFFSFPVIFPAENWNWSGMVLSTIGMLAIAALPMFGWRRAGLTMKQGSGAVAAYVVFALLSGLFFYIAISNPSGRENIETIAFQWTMPGISEEIFYRGVLLFALNEAFAARARILGAPIGWGGLLATLLFGLVHALGVSANGLDFDWMTMAMTGGPALILLWLRERTGSVLLPILAHNIANGAFTLF